MLFRSVRPTLASNRFCVLRKTIGKKDPLLWQNMLDYTITKSDDGLSWRVVCRKDNDLGLAPHKAGDVVFNVPCSTDSKLDMTMCIKLLASNFPTATVTPEASGDRILSFLYSPKYIPITVFTTSSSKVPTVKTTFAPTPMHEGVRLLAVESVRQTAPSLVRFAEGAYISTAPTDANLTALRDKMCKTGTIYNADPKVFKAVSAALLHEFNVKQWKMYATTDSWAPYSLNFNPNSGVGFRHFELMFARNKRNMGPFACRVVERYLELVRQNIGRSEELIPPPVTVYTAKPEVRSVDDPPGKVRLISMLGLIHDFISKLCTLPFMRCLEKWIGCLIGTSIWSSMVFMMMRAMGLAEWMKLDPHTRGEDIDPDDPALWGYITIDISGHDMSYSPVGLFMYLLMRLFCVDFQCIPDEEAFAEMFAVEFAGVNAKTVQWFGGYYYMVLGIMASGWLGTSHIATLMTIHSTYMALFSIYLAAKLHPKDVFTDFKLVAYGDDMVLKFRLTRAELLGDGQYPTKLAAQLKELGLTVKGSETQLLLPTPRHTDKFFTHIRNDEIISGGVHILQRYFVKFDARHNPMHPDSTNYVYILPWRKTDAYATKMSMDAHGFLGKTGRLDDTPYNPYVMAYVKAFGLLCDAGPNRTAHRMLKHFMKAIETAHPGVSKLAVTAPRGDLEEVLKKLSPDAMSIFGPLIQSIIHVSDAKSYLLVVSNIVTQIDARVIKKPPFYYANVADRDDKANAGSPFIKDQQVMYN